MHDEMVNKVTEYIGQRFGTDYDAAWAHYCEADGRVGLSGLALLLEDAKAVKAWMRSFVAQAILKKLDTNKDNRLSREELGAILNG